MKTPKGKLMVIGGSELYGDNFGSITSGSDKFMDLEILKRIVTEIDSQHGKIEIITTASAEYADELGDSYQEAFAEIGQKNTGVLDIRVREDAFDQKYLDRITKARSVVLAGIDSLTVHIMAREDEFSIHERKFIRKTFNRKPGNQTSK